MGAGGSNRLRLPTGRRCLSNRRWRCPGNWLRRCLNRARIHGFYGTARIEAFQPSRNLGFNLACVGGAAPGPYLQSPDDDDTNHTDQ